MELQFHAFPMQKLVALLKDDLRFFGSGHLEPSIFATTNIHYMLQESKALSAHMQHILWIEYKVELKRLIIHFLMLNIIFSSVHGKSEI